MIAHRFPKYFLILFAVLVWGIAPSYSAAFQVEEDDSDSILLRKILVPESDFEAFMQQRRLPADKFIPLQWDEVDRFLDNRATSQKRNLKRADVNLSWNLQNELVGEVSLQVEQNGRGVQFASNLNLADVVPSPTRLVEPLFGRKANGDFYFQAGLPDTFRITATKTGVIENRPTTLLLPPSDSPGTVRISLPPGYKLISDQTVRTVQLAPESEAVSSATTFEIESPGTNLLRIQVVNLNTPRQLSVDARMDFQGDRAVIAYTTELKTTDLVGSAFSLQLPDDFELSFVNVNGVEIQSRVDRRTDGRWLSVPLNLKNDIHEIDIVIAKKLRNDDQLKIPPANVTDFESARFQLAIPYADSNWRITETDPAGFAMQRDSDSSDSTIHFRQNGAVGPLGIKLSRVRQQTSPTLIRVDIKDQSVQTSLLYEQLSIADLIKFRSNWQMDGVENGESPLQYNTHESGPARFVSVEENSPRTWLRFSIPLIARKAYQLDELLPVAGISESVSIEFLPPFRAAVLNDMLAPSGLPVESDQPYHTTTVGQVNRLQFRFPSRSNELVEKFKYSIQIKTTRTSARVTYQIRPISSENPGRLLVNLRSASGWHDENDRPVNARILTRRELRTLGLNSESKFWVLTPKPADENPVFETTFTSNPKSSTLPIEFPKGAFQSSTEGTVEISSFARHQTVFSDLVEIPLRQASGTRKFVSNPNSTLLLRMNTQPEEQSRAIVQRRTLEMTPLGDLRETWKIERSATGKLDLRIQPGQRASKVSLDGEHPVDFELNQSGWVLPAEIQELPLGLEVKIEYHDWNGLPVLFTTDSLLNGNQVTGERIWAAGMNPWRPIRFKPRFELNSRNSVESFLWLPLQLLDTETRNDLRGERTEQYTFAESEMDRGALLIVSDIQLTLLGGALFLMSLLLVYQLKRTRTLFFILLLTFAVGVSISDWPALISGFLFWGVGTGIAIREIIRISWHAPAAVTTLMICLLIQAEPACGQEPASEDQKIQEIVIPIDQEKKPTGIVYVSPTVYDLITRSEPISEPIFHFAKLLIAPNSTPKNLTTITQFQVTTKEPGKIQIPFLFSNSIYSENAVRVNGVAVTFIPDQEKRLLEIRVPKIEKATLEIESVSNLEDLSRALISWNYRGATEVQNDSPMSLAVSPDGKSNGAKTNLVESGQSITVGRLQNARINASPENRPDCTILERIEVGPKAVTRQIAFVRNAESNRKFSFTIPSNWEWIQRPPNATFSIDGLNQKITLDGNDSIVQFRQFGNPIGVHRISAIRAESHNVSRHLISVSTEATLNLRGTLDDGELRSEFQQRWNSIQSTENDVTGMVFDGLENSQLTWRVGPRIQSISGSAEYAHRLSDEGYTVDVNISLTSNGPLRQLVMTVPQQFELQSAKIGSESLPMTAMKQNRWILHCSNRESGSYLVRLELRSKTNRPVVIKTTRLNIADAMLTHKHAIWLGRNCRVSREELTFDAQIDVKGKTARIGLVPPGVTSIPVLWRNSADTTKIFSWNDELKVVNGRLAHKLTFELAASEQLPFWLGIELPFDSRNIAADISAPVVIESSTAFQKKQVWIPVVGLQKRKLSLQFDAGLAADEIRLPVPISASIRERKVELPKRILADQIVWDLMDEYSVSSTQDSTLYNVPNDRSIIGYRIVKVVESSPLVTHLESLFDVSTKQLTCRLFIRPNGARECRVAIAPSQLVRKIILAGQDRKWTQRSDTIAVELMDDKFCQVLELQIATQWIPGENISLPQVVDWPTGPSFLQATGSPAIVIGDSKSNDSQPLLQARREFLSLSIEAFELNRSRIGTDFWMPLLAAWANLAFVDFSDPEDEFGLQLKALNVPEDELTIATPNSINLNRSVFQIDEQTINVGLNLPQPKNLQTLQIAGALAAFAILGLLAHRLSTTALQLTYAVASVLAFWLVGVAWATLAPYSLLAWSVIALGVLMAVTLCVNLIWKMRVWRRAQLAKQIATKEPRSSSGIPT